MPDFFDITEPDAFIPEPTTPLWVWLLVGLAVVMIFALGYFIYRSTRKSKQRTTLLDHARSQLSGLRDSTAKLEAHVIAIRISLIIRRYLAKAFDDPALFETNEEFILRPSALEQLHPDSRQPITEHLTALSQLKYAPEGVTDVSQLIDDAEAILANIEINVGDVDD